MALQLHTNQELQRAGPMLAQERKQYSLTQNDKRDDKSVAHVPRATEGKAHAGSKRASVLQEQCTRAKKVTEGRAHADLKILRHDAAHLR